MKKQILLTGLALVLFCAGISTAADSATYRPYGRHYWTGFYFGLQGSHSHGTSEWELSNGIRFDHSVDGGLGGIFFGYNYQTPANVVVGFEAEINGGRVKGSSSCPNNDFACHTDVYWTGSTRARVGYAIDRFMPYVALGWGYAGVETYARFLANGTDFGNRNSFFGWAPGVGFEFAITRHLAARAEYSYYLLYAKDILIQDTFTDIHLRLNTFKAGILFRF